MADDDRAADLLDRAIDDLLAGRPAAADPSTAELLRHMFVLHQAPVPDGLAGRVGPRPDRRARLAAAILGVLLLWHGLPNVFAPERLARWLGLGYEQHIYREVGLVLLAIGAVVMAGALRTRWLETAARVGVPVGVVLGVWGLAAIAGAPNPAAEVLHIAEGTAAVALAVTFWLPRRRRGHE